MKSPEELGAEWGRRLATRGPRAIGLILVAISIGIALFNLVLLEVGGTFVVLLVLVPPGMFPIGAWILLTGRTQGSPNNPAWWTVGLYTVALLGVGAGVFALGRLNGTW